jgi:tRNA A37 threonylcarbamoyladenosine synthetase subunit TsaC/SUA5/YrdC
MVARLVRLGPLTSTSANRPGQQPSPGPERIAAVFADEVARGELLILDTFQPARSGHSNAYKVHGLVCGFFLLLHVHP